MRSLLVMGVFTTLALAGSAQASLIGDDVDASFAFGEMGDNLFALPSNTTDLVTATVGMGVEFSGGNASLDLDDASAVFSFVNASADIGVALGPGSLLVVQGLDWVNTPGVLTGLGTFGGELADRVLGSATTSDGFIIEFDAITLSPESTVTLTFDLLTEHAQTPPVPEPATAALFAVGLAGVAMRMRRIR